MTEPGRFRYRIRFAKLPAMRFTGHLDLHRTWERTLRRAGAPLAYSQGFSPHPRMNLGGALPLGCTSEADLLDVWLEQAWVPEALAAALTQAAPPGLRVDGAAAVPEGEPALQRQIVAADYEILFHPSEAPEDLPARAAALLLSPALPRQRRGKSYDLRPLVEALEVTMLPGGAQALRMRLAAREGATGRPEEVLQALGVEAALAPACRTQLILGQAQLP